MTEYSFIVRIRPGYMHEFILDSPNIMVLAHMILADETAPIPKDIKHIYNCLFKNDPNSNVYYMMSKL